MTKKNPDNTTEKTEATKDTSKQSVVFDNIFSDNSNSLWGAKFTDKTVQEATAEKVATPKLSQNVKASEVGTKPVQTVSTKKTKTKPIKSENPKKNTEANIKADEKKPIKSANLTPFEKTEDLWDLDNSANEAVSAASATTKKELVTEGKDAESSQSISDISLKQEAQESAITKASVETEAKDIAAEAKDIAAEAKDIAIEDTKIADASLKQEAQESAITKASVEAEAKDIAAEAKDIAIEDTKIADATSKQEAQESAITKASVEAEAKDIAAEAKDIAIEDAKIADATSKQEAQEPANAAAASVDAQSATTETPPKHAVKAALTDISSVQNAKADTGAPVPQVAGDSAVSQATQAGAAGQENFAQLAPSEVDFIPPLLRSLSTLLRLRGKTISPQFLYAGLAGVGEVTPGECMRAASRAGLQAKIMPRASITDISRMTLPCILLMQNGKSCVLTAYSRQVASVIFPESGEEPQQVSLESINSEYTGYAAFGSVEKKADKRIDTFRKEKGKRWFWDAIKHYGPIYRHAAFASVIINLIALGSPLFVMNVYDRVVPNHALETLWVLALGVTIAYLFDFLLRTLRNYFVDTAGRNADVVISSMLVDKVLTMQLDHKPESTGALVNNVREFESLREFFSSSTLLSCIDLPFLILFLLCLSFIGGPLVLLPLIAMPVMFGAGFLLQSLAKRAAEKSYAQSMHKNALLTEIVNGLETLKCCQGENRMQRVWETVVENSSQANAETKKYGSLAVGFSVFVTQFVTVAMVVWGVYLIADGTLTMGGLIGSNILAGRAMAPLMQLAGLITRFQNSRISLDALNTLMALPSEDRQSQATVDFGPLESSFTFENVSFAYPNSARTAVENLSLHISPGEKVGIIGRMGSGKSTLIRLLIGLYQPKDGAVKFGGVDIRQLAGADLRSRVGFAPQDTVLFYGSIRDNIVLGDPSVNDIRTIRAANLSGVIEFVRTNPEGFGAQVGEQGKALSGGQRQAIGLARALVRDPEVLVLDEPTSNMDTSSEQAVQARLTKITKNKTLILITHRMSMLKMVDRLIVMDGGRIVADGPKESVIQKLRASSQSATKAPVAEGASANQGPSITTDKKTA